MYGFGVVEAVNRRFSEVEFNMDEYEELFLVMIMSESMFGSCKCDEMHCTNFSGVKIEVVKGRLTKKTRSKRNSSVEVGVPIASFVNGVFIMKLLIYTYQMLVLLVYDDLKFEYYCTKHEWKTLRN